MDSSAFFLPVAVRPLHRDQGAQLVSLLNRWAEDVPYTARFTSAGVDAEIFGVQPSTLRNMVWLHSYQLGAWLGETLVGYADLATAYASPLASLAGERPVGHLRFLALPRTRPDTLIAFLGGQDLAEDVWVDTVAYHLLVEAERFWREQGVRQVVAFGLEGGYPGFQAGAGVLPGEWSHHFRVLTQAGFRLQDRYYCLHRRVGRTLEEDLPGLKISLAQVGSDRDRRYAIYQRAHPVAQARLFVQEVDYPGGVNPVGVLVNFQVEEAWRSQGVGRWLLRRMVNDATLQGCQRLVFHVHPDNHGAIYLFTQAGFEELDFRGYVFAKDF